MIGSKNRFRGRRDPRIVLKYGKTERNGPFQIKYLQNKDSQQWRVAVIVGNKVTKSAPLRNRIRRRIYEIIRENGLKPSTDLIVLVYDKNVAKEDYEKIKNSLLGLLEKANII